MAANAGRDTLHSVSPAGNPIVAILFYWIRMKVQQLTCLTLGRPNGPADSTGDLLNTSHILLQWKLHDDISNGLRCWQAKTPTHPQTQLKSIPSLVHYGCVGVTYLYGNFTTLTKGARALVVASNSISRYMHACLVTPTKRIIISVILVTNSRKISVRIKRGTVWCNGRKNSPRANYSPTKSKIDEVQNTTQKVKRLRQERKDVEPAARSSSDEQFSHTNIRSKCLKTSRKITAGDMLPRH